MNTLLNSLLPYLEYSSFNYAPTVGKEKTSLDLYYNHRMYAGSIGVDNNKLYLRILTGVTESVEDSFPQYYNDLNKFLDRFNLKPIIRFSEWNNEYQRVYEILSVKQSLTIYVDTLSKCLQDKTKASAKMYVETVRKIVDEFG